jgi:D-xylose transport system permease protein
MATDADSSKIEAAGRRPAGLKLGIFDDFSRLTGLDTRLLAMLGAMVVIWIVLDLMTGGLFLTPRNLFNLAVQGSAVGIMATGMVLVIVARHIDLSVGSVLGFVGMSIAYLQVEVLPLGAAWNWPLTIVFGLALGALVGLWQGLWIARGGVPAFVVTLGGLLIFRGAAFEITDGRTVAPLDPVYQLLGGGIDGSIGATASWTLGLSAMADAVVAVASPPA